MIKINSELKMPLYQQIYEQIKAKIIAGAYKEGMRLTSTRELARDLCVGRNTVENAYGQLCLEGYMASRPGSGFVVLNVIDDLLPLSLKTPAREISDLPTGFVPSGKKADRSSHNLFTEYKYDFHYGSLDHTFFPYSLWRRLTTEALSSFESQNVNYYNDKQGELCLRIEIMNYLRESRGVRCTPDQIVLCCGTQYALDLICALFPEGNRKVAMEEPGYSGVRIVFEKNNYEIKPIPIGPDGMDISKLKKSSARLTYITPSHQFPTGVVMPIQYRAQLLQWAVQRDGVIIEDDYDSEYRYHSRPIPSLQSIDNHGRVIYLGTFSKSLAPGLRMSYMVLPEWLLDQYRSVFEGYHSTVPWIEQKAMSLFMAGGHWEKHLRKVCLKSNKKHEILLHEIRRQMGDKVRIHSHNAGLHILLEFLNGEHQERLIEQAKEHQVRVYPTLQFWYTKECCRKNFVLMGFSKLTEEEIVDGIGLLNKAWFAFSTYYR